MSSSSTISLQVKWGKEVLDIQLDPSLGVQGLKSTLEEKTHVPIHRQKILAKTKGLWKGVLKDTTDLMSIDWLKAKPPLSVMLMGSAEEISSPTVKTVFMEDLPEEEKAKVAEPAGLVNLGNTCYLNAVVQCLRAVPDFTTQLQHTAPAAPSNPHQSLFMRALSDTFRQLSAQTTAVQPLQLVRAVQLAFPQFAQLTRDGRPMQQDAEEFYSGLMALLPESANHLFSMQLQETLTCNETTGTENAEPPVTKHELHRKLVCNIGTDSTYVEQGIGLGLKGTIEKHSAVLGRDAVWTREQRLAELPQILTVQFGRFFWKATPDSQDHQGVKCKIMKPMTFNDTLDVYNFCSTDIQAVLKKTRAQALQEEEEAIDRKLKGEEAKMETDEAATEDTKMEEDDDDELKAALAMSMEAEATADTTTTILGPGIPSTFQGYYELFAVVTHKGRDADGGHYLAWVKSPSTAGGGEAQKIAGSDVLNEDWYVYDDDTVNPCKTEDVLKLKGGGDWHMSYLNFYRLKK